MQTYVISKEGSRFALEYFPWVKDFPATPKTEAVLSWDEGGINVHFVSYETNLAYAKAIAPYVTQIHVFNWEEKNRYPLKDAVETWRSYLSCFEGEHALLLEHMPNNLPEELASEADALRQIAEGL